MQAADCVPGVVLRRGGDLNGWNRACRERRPLAIVAPCPVAATTLDAITP
jgi:hypothetical protein